MDDDTVLRKRRKQQPAAEPASSDARSGGKDPDHEEQVLEPELEPQADSNWLTRVLFIRCSDNVTRIIDTILPFFRKGNIVSMPVCGILALFT